MRDIDERLTLSFVDQYDGLATNCKLSSLLSILALFSFLSSLFLLLPPLLLLLPFCLGLLVDEAEEDAEDDDVDGDDDDRDVL